MPINPTEQHFCQLMEADPIVRRDLIREWKALPPQVAVQLEELLDRFESPAENLAAEKSWRGRDISFLKSI